MLQVTLKSIC